MLQNVFNPVLVPATPGRQDEKRAGRPDGRDNDEMRQVFLQLGRVTQVSIFFNNREPQHSFLVAFYQG